MAEDRKSADDNAAPAREPTKTALGEGLPPNVDARRLGEKDSPQLDWDDAGDAPAEGVAYGADHANRPRKTEAERGQGARTIERNRQIAKGGLYR